MIFFINMRKLSEHSPPQSDGRECPLTQKINIYTTRICMGHPQKHQCKPLVQEST